MRFYQTLRFRITICAVLLVTSVAVVLTYFIQDLDKEVLRKHEVDAQLDETSLRFREVSAEVQVVRMDAVALVNASPVRGVQWAKRHFLGDMEFTPPPNHLRNTTTETEAVFTKLLRDRPAYLQVAYYFDQYRTKEGPLIVRSRPGLSDRALPRDLPPDMVARAIRSDSDVSFSGVRVWGG